MARPHYAPGVPDEIEPVTGTLTTLLDTAVKRYPDRLAMDFIGKTTTYSELGEMVERTAAMLSLAGVKRGDVVSAIMPNCPQHVAVAYATWKLGAVLAEHNPLAPATEIRAQIENHGGKVIVGWEKPIQRLAAETSTSDLHLIAVDLTAALPLRSRLLLKLPVKAARAQRVKMRASVPPTVDSFEALVKAAPTSVDITQGAATDDIAVYLHTGGTTGSPKAVCLSHRNILSNYEQIIAWLPQFKQGQETIGSVLPFFHAFGMALSLVLSVGLAATQNVMPQFDVDMLVAANKRHPMTFFGGVPPMYERILAKMDEDPTVSFSKMQYSVCGAMPLDPELARAWEERTGGYIIEGYGMTEASPVISGSPVSPDRRPSTLGLPFPSTEVKIVNPDNPDEELPDGEVGELVARGPQVFQGYLNQPEETEATLWRGEWLRTGDLAKKDDDFFIMVDRRKELIINGGFNIYPSQVEEAVRSMPGVIDVAVVGVPDGSRGEQVVAALVLEPGANVDLDAVRRWTQDKLSHYAMPKSIAVLDELPRSQLGKVMRRSVRERLDNFELHKGQWRERVAQSTEDFKSRASEARGDLRERASKMAHSFTEKVEGTIEELRNRTSSTSSASSADEASGSGGKSLGRHRKAASVDSEVAGLNDPVDPADSVEPGDVPDVDTEPRA